MEVAAKKSNHGANVRRWREWRNMNQDVLAEQIGISQATLCGYEKKEKLDPELLEKIATALNIPVEAITEVEGGTAINIISGPFHDSSTSISSNNYYPTFNPMDKILELSEEKNALYERMLKEKDRVIEMLQEMMKERK